MVILQIKGGRQNLMCFICVRFPGKGIGLTGEPLLWLERFQGGRSPVFSPGYSLVVVDSG